MKRKIGMYDLGCRKVNLVIDTAIMGGSYNCGPDTGSGVAVIVVGLKVKWPLVVSTLLHESIECAYAEMGLRYVATPDYSSDNGNWHFIMSHTQFSEATARAAYFIDKALPDLAKAYRKYKPVVR